VISGLALKHDKDVRRTRNVLAGTATLAAVAFLVESVRGNCVGNSPCLFSQGCSLASCLFVVLKVTRGTRGSLACAMSFAIAPLTIGMWWRTPVATLLHAVELLTPALLVGVIIYSEWENSRSLKALQGLRSLRYRHKSI